MSMKSALILSVLIPVGLAVSFPAQAFGPGGQRGIERPAFSDLDLNGDGQLTLEEMQLHREARFAERDTDGDGNLSRAEVIAAATDRIAERVDAMFAQYDDNEDGLLSANERDDMRQRGPDPERMFVRLDADEDGMISEAEFDQAAQMGRRHGGQHGGFPGHRNGPSNG